MCKFSASKIASPVNFYDSTLVVPELLPFGIWKKEERVCERKDDSNHSITITNVALLCTWFLCFRMFICCRLARGQRQCSIEYSRLLIAKKKKKLPFKRLKKKGGKPLFAFQFHKYFFPPLWYILVDNTAVQSSPFPHNPIRHVCDGSWEPLFGFDSNLSRVIVTSSCDRSQTALTVWHT